MKPSVAQAANPLEIPLLIVGSNKFGRYPKISDESTFNMIISDDWLVPFPGYRMIASINPSSHGRTSYFSNRWGNAIVIIGNAVYGVSPPPNSKLPLSYFFIGNINTYNGDVFIDENNAGQIAICDGQAIWIFNWFNPSTPGLIQAVLPIDESTNSPIVPGYITFQGGYFITGNKESSNWFLSKQNNGLEWNWGAGNIPVFSPIQTKPTNFVAAIRAPGRGDLLYVMGTNVTQFWYLTGAAIFPYQLGTATSVDYGCLSPNTIAAMDTMIVWLGVNERSGPVIMVSAGADITKISNDGIDFKLAALNNPKASYGFLFKEDGHLFYQITFSDPSDNFSLIYDFNTQSFFYVTDENMNYHPAESVFFMGNSYYFVSINDGNLYQLTTDQTIFDYTIPGSSDLITYEIPRVRVCPPIRMPDSSRFVINNANFTMEQGNDLGYQNDELFLISGQDGYVISGENGIELSGQQNMPKYQPRVDMSMSKDGASSFSSFAVKELNRMGIRANRVVFWQLGSANDVTFQFRFWSTSRALATNGTVNIYQ